MGSRALEVQAGTGPWDLWAAYLEALQGNHLPSSTPAAGATGQAAPQAGTRWQSCCPQCLHEHTCPHHSHPLKHCEVTHLLLKPSPPLPGTQNKTQCMTRAHSLEDYPLSQSGLLSPAMGPKHDGSSSIPVPQLTPGSLSTSRPSTHITSGPSPRSLGTGHVTLYESPASFSARTQTPQGKDLCLYQGLEQGQASSGGQQTCFKELANV